MFIFPRWRIATTSLMTPPLILWELSTLVVHSFHGHINMKTKYWCY